MHTIGVFACVFDEKGHVLCVRANYGDRLGPCPEADLRQAKTPFPPSSGRRWKKR